LVKSISSTSAGEIINKKASMLCKTYLHLNTEGELATLKPVF
jgi:hypothetical protein